MAYFDEYQQLMLELDHRGEQVNHNVTHFKVGINKDISTRMTLHKFYSIDGIFQMALEVEMELKEGLFMASQPEATKAVKNHPPRHGKRFTNRIITQRKIHRQIREGRLGIK